MSEPQILYRIGWRNPSTGTVSHWDALTEHREKAERWLAEDGVRNSHWEHWIEEVTPGPRPASAEG
jgi:hypothetical protein